MTLAVQAEAYIDGLTGTSFQFTAKSDYISTSDGNSILIWGFANGNNRAQYPGPTLIVNQGDTVTVTLTNALIDPTSRCPRPWCFPDTRLPPPVETRDC